MKIVIDISEESYKATCDGCMLPPDVESVVQGIKNGTPLPKGHGDCISREAATNRFDLVQSDDLCMSYDDIMAFLLSLPSVEPERKTGKWIRGEAYPHRIYCSECYKTFIPNDEMRAWVDGDLPRKYCPECGARMEVDG